MKIHIVGAGPTGLSLAWEILKSTDHEVYIYDRKMSAGGSWWEPSVEERDMHSHRMVFDRAFVNTRSLFQEMGIDWNVIFQKDDVIDYYKSFTLKDYGALTSLAVRVLAQPNVYKSVSLKDALGPMSEEGGKMIERVTQIMDGVTWDVMSAYEFVKNPDHVLTSTPYTQRVSGKVMCDAMEEAVLNAGGHFTFNITLDNVEYEDDAYKATFSNGTVIDDGMLFLCLDNSPALNFLGDNWGPDADKKVRESTYGAINVLLDYEEPIKIPPYTEIETEWNLIPKVLPDGKTISCVICHLTDEILHTDPETLKAGVIQQLNLPHPPKIARIGWGSDWNGEKWTFTQSSGVLSLHGQLPFFGKCTKVAMCGMMSERQTPYSSIEAAVEVSRALSHEVFGTRTPLHNITLTQQILFFVVILIVLILLYRNRNT